MRRVVSWRVYRAESVGSQVSYMHEVIKNFLIGCCAQRNEANEMNKLNSNACLSFPHTFHMHNMPKHTSIYTAEILEYVRSFEAERRGRCRNTWPMWNPLTYVNMTYRVRLPAGRRSHSRFCQEIDSESNEDRQPRRQEYTTTRLHETAEIVGPAKSNEHCRRAERASLSPFQLWISHCENV